MRAFLIILVVLGHVLSTVPAFGQAFLYVFIYSFHMPAMIFLSGMCAKDKINIKIILKRILLPYVVFQILMFLLNFLILRKNVEFTFLTPDWILWYLMALAFWSLAIPFFKTESRKKRVVLFSISVLVSLLVGYIDSIGLFLSLSRTVVFFPFFLSGFYSREKMKEKKRGRKALTIIVYILAGFSILLISIFCNNIKLCWFYYFSEKTPI